MSEQQNKQPIELPGLQATNINTIASDVHITESDVPHPQLLLEGDDEAFTHSFDDGHLTVREKPNSGIVVGQNLGGVHIGGITGNIRAGNMVISGGSVRISGGEVHVGPGGSVHISGDIEGAARRRAQLLLPKGHEATSHDISTTSGDVELERLTARVLRVASVSGGLALHEVAGEDVRLETKSGGVELEQVKSSKPVRAKTISGSVTVEGGDAPSWNLDTVSGGIEARGAKGTVDASTVSGRTRVSQ